MWLKSTLKNHSMGRINIHGEADDLSDEEVAVLMRPWQIELQELVEDKEVGPSCRYNDDQTGIFYQKLPKLLYVQKTNKSNFKGTKYMKDKTHAAGMICNTADGFKLPIALIGKAKNPTCFQLLDPGVETPLPYKR